MLAQLHASGLLQSLLLKNMQAAYARMQGAAVQVRMHLPLPVTDATNKSHPALARHERLPHASHMLMSHLLCIALGSE